MWILPRAAVAVAEDFAQAIKNFFQRTVVAEILVVGSRDFLFAGKLLTKPFGIIKEMRLYTLYLKVRHFIKFYSTFTFLI